MSPSNLLVLLGLFFGSCASATAANNPFSSKPPVSAKAPVNVQAIKGLDTPGATKENAIPLPVDLPPPPAPDKAGNPGVTSHPTSSKSSTVCNVELLRQKQPLRIGASGGPLEVLLRAKGRGCTRGAMADDEWLSVASFSDTKVVLQAAPNVSNEERTTTLVIAATADAEGASLTVTQGGQGSAGKGNQP